MNQASDIVDRARVRGTRTVAGTGVDEARRQLRYELISGISGLILALFMWGHMFFVGSILLGSRGFDWIAESMERVYIAQPTVLIILSLFMIHAVYAARKIPAQMRERRRQLELARELRGSRSRWRMAQSSSPLPHHVESWLWIWQLRTGLVIAVLGSFHLVLMAMDIFTPLWGDRIGIEAATSMARTSAGLVWAYAVLLICVEFHAGVGLYRLAVKWGMGKRLSRRLLHGIEQLLLWFFLGLGAVVLLVLAGLIDPPLAFLLEN